MAPAYLQLIPRFESATTLKAVTVATSTGLGAQAIVARLRAGEPADVVLIASYVMDQLVKDGLIRGDSRVDVARSSVGMAVPAGARTGVVGDVVASGQAEIGFQQISELRAVQGVDYVGPLPGSVQRVSVFSAGIAAKAPNPEGAKALLELLMSAEGRRIMQQTGLDPIAPQ